MDISLFDYYLPKGFIAQESIEPRDHSRLLILDRKTKKIEHKRFYELLNYLSDKDVLVFNNSKVVPARLYGKKISSHGKVEIFLIRPENKEFFNFISWPKRWVIIGKPQLKQGQIIEFSKSLKGKIESELNYERVICFNIEGEDLKQEILSLGQSPLPPYITEPTEKSFLEYQTIYAEKEGSIAAPTAGFHFTKDLFKKIEEKGIDIQFITLHIGLGTFLSVKSQDIEKHEMHSEFFEFSKDTAKILNKAKLEGKRIVAVGTTAARVLESCSNENSGLEAKQGWTNLFIYPGYKFKFVDSLITNFHLPKSTLLMLVSAFAGRDLILKAYQEAIEKKYRFFSFGDAMFIV
ncbi:MAG TPA: tRNA preQ1(34) S-adenosylmethionine ribosyltransferase-isomerase QueA [Candidatus Paceibacterota bacterium]|nr:tRNA preQ1(34) S-adenosylmethionine ribosyltransferase-isomerase QueA [Candidatus Paceibacterota bacterium]